MFPQIDLLTDPYTGDSKRARVSNVQSLRINLFLLVTVNDSMEIVTIERFDLAFSRATAKQMVEGQNQHFDYFATMHATRVEVEELHARRTVCAAQAELKLGPQT